MRYSAERKNAALAMMQNHSINHTSNELGIHSTTLLRWRKEKAELFPKAVDESSAGVEVEVVDGHSEESSVDQLDECTAEISNTGHVRDAQTLLLNPKPALVGEIVLLLAENDRLTAENTRLRKALKEMLA